MSLYHKDVFMPRYITAKTFSFQNIHVSEHCHNKMLERQIWADPYTDLSIVYGEQVVKAEERYGAVVKLVVRKPYSATQDICYVLSHDFIRKQPVVVTCWLNDRNDNHITLDISKYDKE